MESSSQQEEIKQLNLEIEKLSRQLEVQKQESENAINKIQTELDIIKNNVMVSKSSPSKTVARIMDKIMEMKRKNVEESANIENENKITISQLRVEIAESNKKLLQHKSQNAELTVENLSYKTKINKLTLLYERKIQDIANSRNTFENRTNELISRETDFYGKCLNRMNQLQHDFPSINNKILSYKKAYTELIEEAKHFETDVQEYNYIIDHLIRSISFLTDVPLTKCPTSKDVLGNPDLLQKFIQHSYNVSTTAKQLARSKLMASSLSLSQILKPRIPSVSLPVAKVLTSLGAVSFDVAEKMESNHRDTMTMLDPTGSPTKDISSMDFLSTSI